MKSGHILFVQLPIPRISFSETLDNVPLAGAYLLANLRKWTIEGITAEILDPELVNVLGDTGLLEVILDKTPDIVCFTLYLWNAERSLNLAKNLKGREPKIVTIAGGPEVTQDNNWILSAKGFDFTVIGEGEEKFVNLLKALYEATPWPSKDHTLTNLCDLKTLDNPYLVNLIKPTREGRIFLETSRGCSSRCIYCYYHKSYPGQRTFALEQIEAVFSRVYAKESLVQEIYLMDPTFNDRPDFREVLKLAKKYRGRKQIDLHAELRAELLTKDDVELFQEAGLVSAEIGLQTINKEALQLVGRHLDLKKFEIGVNLLKKARIKVITDIIVGLPGDSPEGVYKTVAWLKKSSCYSEVHPFVLSVLPGTELRKRAKELGIEFDPFPPYHVISTKTFTRDNIRSILAHCEEAFSKGYFYYDFPSLIEKDSRGYPKAQLLNKRHSDPEQREGEESQEILRLTPQNDVNILGFGMTSNVFSWPELDKRTYVSKCILTGLKQDIPATAIAKKATDPFCFWFKGDNFNDDQKMIQRVLAQFFALNPFTVLNIIFEYCSPPHPDHLKKLAGVLSNEKHYLNRFLSSLYGEKVFTVNFTLILPDLKNLTEMKNILQSYDHLADVVWRTSIEGREDVLKKAGLEVFSLVAKDQAQGESGDFCEYILVLK